MTASTLLLRNTPLLCATLIVLTILPAYATGDLLVDQYTDEHGLAQNSIKGIGRDNLGFVWLISEKGPIRYDGGARFRTFDEMSAFLKSDRMVALHRGTQPGELWAQTESDEMILLKDGKPTVSGKSFWEVFGRLSVPLEKPLAHSLRLPPHSRYPHPENLIIPDGAGGNYLLSPGSIDIFPVNRTDKTVSVRFPTAHPWNFVGLYGYLFHFEHIHGYTAISREGVVTERTMKGDLSDLPLSTPFTLYWNPASRQLFIYAAEKLYRIAAPGDGMLHSTLLIDGFDFTRHDIISIHYMEQTGKILLGSAMEGLFVIQKRNFSPAVVDKQYANNIFYTQLLLPSGLLLTDYGVLFDKNGKSQWSSPPLKGRKDQRGQIIGPGGNTWVAMDDSILVLSPDSRRIVDRKPNAEHARIIFKDSQSRYWLGGDRGILTRYDARLDTFIAQISLDTAITYIEQASNRQLLIGTSDGLMVYDGANSETQAVPALRGKHIRSIYRDADNRHWITTYQHGIFLYENGNVTAFPLDRRSHLATAHCMLEDKKGFLWISTNKGLFKVGKQQLLDYRADSETTPFYVYYDKTSGFRTNEFNGGCQPCAIELPNGHFSFPSLHGLVQFNPLAVADEFPTGGIILDQALIKGTPLPLEDTIRVPSDFSRLDVKIAMPFYGNPHNVEIEYMLDGSNKRADEWLSLDGLRHPLSINELSAGIHVLRVRTRKGLAPGNFQYASFYFYVQPLFHETWWFTAMLCTGAGLILWLLVYLRTQLILKQNRWLLQKVNERTEDLKKQYEWQQRLSASITHDIKTPLNYVVKTLYAMQSLAKDKRITPDEIKQVYYSTQHIYHYSNNLTNLAKVMRTKEWLELGDICLHQVIQNQIDIFQPIARFNGNTINNQIPPHTVARAHADILSVIVHNILDNAIKFTKNGTIAIKMEKSAVGMIAFSISDTGIGLRPELTAYYNTAPHFPQKHGSIEKGSGLGLLLTKDIAQLINAEMTIQSTLGKGTSVTFILHQRRASGTYRSSP